MRTLNTPPIMVEAPGREAAEGEYKLCSRAGAQRPPPSSRESAGAHIQRLQRLPALRETPKWESGGRSGGGKSEDSLGVLTRVGVGRSRRRPGRGKLSSESFTFWGTLNLESKFGLQGSEGTGTSPEFLGRRLHEHRRLRSTFLSASSHTPLPPPKDSSQEDPRMGAWENECRGDACLESLSSENYNSHKAARGGHRLHRRRPPAPAPFRGVS